MRAVLIRSIAVIGAGAVVLAVVLYVATTFDARPPTVLEIRLTAPSADDERVALITTSIEVVYSEPVATVGAEEALRIEPEVAGAATWSGSTMRFTPADPLELDATYTVTVGEGVRDPAGNLMTELPPPFEFSTAGRPALLASEPEDGADDVPLEAPIALTFSTAQMDTASVENELRLSPAFDHELRWSGALLEIVPTEPLEPAREYEVLIGADAADYAGVTLGEPVQVSFRTIAPSLEAATIVPADGVDGIATISPIAVIFNRPIDPGTVDGDQLTITPEVAGTLDVVALPSDPSEETGAGRLLRFTPSGPLPANTTFQVELAAELTTTSGDALAEPLAWSFTTGAPTATISNGIAFVTDRAGIANVWVMNPDGTGQRQVSAEVEPVVDYAVAPDGGSLVVSDGRRLVYQRADGTDRRELTDAAHLEFDPTYSPDGQRVAFARADAATGAGLGLWAWDVGGGDATPIELPEIPDGEPVPSGQPATAPSLRTPRYSPDGQALAFVDLSGRVGILDLSDDGLTLAPFAAAAPPIWMPDSLSILLMGSRTADGDPAGFHAPVAPLVSGPTDSVHRLNRTGTAVVELGFGVGAAVLDVAPDGRILYADRSGGLRIADAPTEAPVGPPITEGSVAGAALSPSEAAAVAVFSAIGEAGSLDLVELTDGDRTPLATSGARPRWLP
jgi:TolB protein